MEQGRDMAARPTSALPTFSAGMLVYVAKARCDLNFSHRRYRSHM